jgi:autophagy-related protein 5
LLTGLDPTQRKNGIEEIDSSIWTVTLHHKNYPSEYILKIDNLETVADLWLQQAKEACFMRDGNAKAIMALSTEDTAALWQSVRQRE